MRGNVISGNRSDGVELRDGTHHNSITSNKIGTNAAGTGAVTSEFPESGVSCRLNAHHNTIGRPGEGNVISGNGSRNRRVVR